MQVEDLHNYLRKKLLSGQIINIIIKIIYDRTKFRLVYLHLLFFYKFLYTKL